jgi:N-acetylglucosaminyldiphosphoundecaprenol N-acetyl-beta-D-mannosaminyltransferase
VIHSAVPDCHRRLILLANLAQPPFAPDLLPAGIGYQRGLVKNAQVASMAKKAPLALQLTCPFFPGRHWQPPIDLLNLRVRRPRMRTSLFGCPIDVLTMAQTVDRAHEAMRTRKRVQHVSLNVAKLVNLRTDPLLSADVMGSDLVGIDGMGIVLAARLVGIPVQERVAGIDVFLAVLALCAEKGFRPFFLGARPDIVRRAADEAAEKYPGIRFAGIKDGYFAPERELEIVAEIRDSGADCLFIGMPTPRKERFLAAHRDALGIPFIMGVGGSFDVLAGYVRRAPTIVQSAGFEWLYRVYQEPRRMWWRYAKTNSVFAGMLIGGLFDRLRLNLQKNVFRY